MSGVIFVATFSYSYSFTEVNQNWTLDSDFKGSLRIQGRPRPGQFPFVNLNGHKITVDSGGVEINPNTSHAYFMGGVLTSSESLLETRFSGQEYSSIQLDVVISDSSRQVGLRITSNNSGDSGFYLTGNQSNTFTRNVEVSGRRNHLVLRKQNGAIAVRSDIIVKNQALLRFEASTQLLKTSNVTLRRHGVLQNLANSDISNTFQRLIVEDNGIIHFNHEEGNSLNSKYYIKVDNLIINQGGHLEVHGWQEWRDFLLVRKNSQCLADELTKMEFAGYDRNNIHLEDFDTEYWSISATPEPTTYGAILGTVGIGLWCWHKRRRGTYRIH